MTTHRALALGLAFTLASALALPGADARKPKPLRWKTVTIQVACEAVQPTACRGHDGFTIAADGSYTVGPAASGATATGTLTADELATIAATADALATTSAKARPTCDKRPGLPGTNLTLTLTPKTGKPLTVFEATRMGQGSHCTVGKRALALRLEAAVEALLAAHYPVPFPAAPAPPTPRPAALP